MKYDMILAGVGGQGVLSLAAIIGIAAVESGLHLKQAEVHGMAQRGGAVQSHLRISDRPVFSDIIPVGQADMILSMEPMETLRYVAYLAEGGVIVADREPVVNIPDYPPLDTILNELEGLPRSYLVAATEIARAMRSVRASNMVLLGAASVFLPLEPAQLEAAIRALFARKGNRIVAKNLEAFQTGRQTIESAQAV